MRLVPSGKSLTPAIPFGDSIVASFGDWFTGANRLAGTPFEMVRNAGVGGDTTAQMVARVQADVIDHGPEWVVVEGGGNSVANGVSAASITADLGSIYSSLQGAGIRIVATPVCPSTSYDTVSERDVFDSVNAWIRGNYASYGAVLCDWDAAIREPDAYLWRTGLDTDGVHPSVDGKLVMADELAATLSAAGL